MRNGSLLLLIMSLYSGYSFALSYQYEFPDGLEEYDAGTRVKGKDGEIYECKSYPNNGLCQQFGQDAIQYSPGEGSGWQQAWNKMGGTKQKVTAGNNNFNFIVMADPQAWRLDNGSDPNSTSNRPAWAKINDNAIQSMNKLNETMNIQFGIINGDITEYGKEPQWKSFQNSYKNLKFRYIYGLGNHDYDNNVSDCYDGLITNNGCAGNMVGYMRSDMANEFSRLPAYSDDAAGKKTHSKGSLSYSWDWGNLHFVQMQNYPTYERVIDAWNNIFDIRISRSLRWLEDDLRSASQRGKFIILNFHDGHDKFIKNTSTRERDYFKKLLIQYNVSAIFVGHGHSVSMVKNKDFYGDVPVFMNGSLFKGDYYLVQVVNNKIKVTNYHGSTGSPELNKEMGEVTLRPQAQICKTWKHPGNVGDVYGSPLLYTNVYLFSHVASGRHLDGDKNGNIYLFDYNDGGYQKFYLQNRSGDLNKHDGYFSIISIATSRALSANADGKVQSVSGTSIKDNELWRVMQTSDNRVMFINRGTGQTLEASGNEVKTTWAGDPFNDNQKWRMVLDSPRAELKGTHYYRLKNDSGYAKNFPLPGESNEDWEYIAPYQLLKPNPCIGW